MNKWKQRKVQNEKILLKIKVAPINEKMSEGCLIWFGCVQKRATNAPIRINGFIQVK